nr:hypothetical protein [Tanacetum cinerariifolium]
MINLHIIRDDLLLEPVKKGKRVKRPAKKSTTVPTISVVIKDTPGVSVSKKKAPAKVDRSKGFKILSDVALSKAAQFKEATKRSKKDYHISQASGSGDGTDFESERFPIVPTYDSESENESWGDSEDDNDDDSKGDDDKADSDDDGNSDSGDNERTDSDDDDENPSFTLKDCDEEHDKEYESDDDYKNVFKEEDVDLYKDVEVRSLGPEHG